MSWLYATIFQVDVVKEPSREIPVMRKVDVVVVGGGPGGFGAAVAAARNGAETLLHRTLWFLRWYANREA